MAGVASLVTLPTLATSLRDVVTITQSAPYVEGAPTVRNASETAVESATSSAAVRST
jgi:hypothetical protein